MIDENLYSQYYLLKDIEENLTNGLYLFSLSTNKESEEFKNTIEEFKKSLLQNISKIYVDQSEIQGLLTKHIESYLNNNFDNTELVELLERYLNEIVKSITKEPNSFEKAEKGLKAIIKNELYYFSSYDHFVLFKEDIPKKTIDDILKIWKREKESHQERSVSPAFSDIFWYSRDFEDGIDAITRYKFKEQFQIIGFEKAFLAVEDFFASNLLQGTDSFDPNLPIPENQLSVFYLWHVSRSKELAAKLSDYVGIFLKKIVDTQNTEKAWGKFPNKEGCSEVELSALCALCLLKLSTSEKHFEKGIEGAKWLINNQNSDGSWSGESNFGVKQPNIFTTLISMEAIVRSALPNATGVIEHGIEWISSKQDKLGFWNEKGWRYIEITVLVLEFINFFNIKKTTNIYLSDHLEMCKGYLKRSLQFAQEDSVNSHRIAITVAFHGIEAFLYSLLSHNSINQKIFENKNETIGMRKALTKFQEHLQTNNLIKPGNVVLYRNSLDSLAHYRDEVVHKGIPIISSTSRLLIDDAIKFTSEYSRLILGYDIWE